MKIRPVLLWMAVNAALTIVAVVCCAVWLVFSGPSQEFGGAPASGRGGLLPISTLLFLVGATLLVANVGYVVVTAARRR